MFKKFLFVSLFLHVFFANASFPSSKLNKESLQAALKAVKKEKEIDVKGLYSKKFDKEAARIREMLHSIKHKNKNKK